MKNPLHKRLWRELVEDKSKYIVIFLLMSLTIAIGSGFLVADESMIKAYDESFEKYHIEDGHFMTSSPLNKAQEKRLKSHDIDVYDLSFKELTLDTSQILRFFINRTAINRACVMKGRLAEQEGEIAIDRMFADNNHLQIGDILTCREQSWTITGLVALSDYSTMFQNNSDMMFDSLSFGVGVVTESAFEKMMHSTLTHCYAWKYHHPPLSEQEEVDFGNDLLEKVNDIVDLEEWVPQYINQAIIFTGDDMGGDKVMVELVVYILIVIIAFVFAVTISNTIVKEATIIGTLRASGYTKGELLRHYLILPVIITLLGAVAGNIAGYTIMKDVCVDLYYQSYSLPTYTTIWNMSAFIRTTLIPLVLMVVINTAVLMDKLRLTPLKFLRHDLKRSRQQRTLKLSPRIPFFDRYRMRIFLQNIGNYAVLVTGILFATILLLFGLALPNIIDNYQKRIEENMLSDYQYILKIPPSALNEDRKLESYINMMIYATKVETKNKTAEKFSAYTLKTLGDEAREESITCYGIIKNSRYINLPEDREKVYISSLFAEKYNKHAGDQITLKEAYEETFYTFTVGGIYDYNGSVCFFMDQTLMNRMFHLGDSFSGYFAKTPITDIDQSCIGTVIDLRALTSLSRQLDHSMGSMTYILDGISVIIYLIVIYLLSKTIIEKNAQSISMTKILGYSNREIAKLYIVTISLVTIGTMAAAPGISYMFLKPIFMAMMRQEMTGWIMFDISRRVFLETFLIGVAAYSVVALIEYRKVKRVPMDQALKNIE